MVHGSRDALRTLREAAARWAVRGRLPLTIALAGALAGWGLYLGNQAYVRAISPTSCPAGCVTNGALFVSSDPAMQNIENKIAAANGSATAGAYYSVVLLDPFTYSATGTVSQSRMVDELQGAELALAAANATVASKHAGVEIQLLLANEGTSAEEGESQAVQQIENLEGPDRIVAVAGMGLSTEATETAATALSQSQVSLPMFGAVTTGDTFDGDSYPGFFQIVPDVDAQVSTLVSQLGLAGPQPVALISSDQQSDIYSTDLKTDFMKALGYSPTALGYSPPLGEYSYDPATAEQQFMRRRDEHLPEQRARGQGAIDVPDRPLRRPGGLAARARRAVPAGQRLRRPHRHHRHWLGRERPSGLGDGRVRFPGRRERHRRVLRHRERRPPEPGLRNGRSPADVGLLRNALPEPGV